jgi:hypothetical protein
MYQATATDTHDNCSNSNHNLLDGGPTTDYTEITYHASASSRGGSQHGDLDSSSHRGNLNSRSSLSTRSSHIPIRRAGTASLTRGTNSQEESDHDLSHSEANPPLLEIPEEIYAVRKAALQVLKPLTRTWVRQVEIGEGGFPRVILLRPFCACIGCSLRWLLPDSPLWNDTLDTFVESPLLVYFVTVVVLPRGFAGVPYLIGTGTIEVHFRSQRQ